MLYTATNTDDDPETTSPSLVCYHRTQIVLEYFLYTGGDMDPTPIGVNIQTDDPVTLSHTDRFTGTYIVGKMGMGKSTFIQSLLADHLVHGDGFCVIEPKGDLIEDILTMIPKIRQTDVVLLDYGDSAFPPGFDIFDASKLTTIEEKAAYIREVVNSFEKTLGDQSWGSRMETVIMAIAATFAENPGTTLVQIERLFDDEAFRRRCYARMTSITAQSARRFWDQYDRTKGKDNYVDSVLTKVRRFLFDPMLLAVTAQAGRSFDFSAAIARRQIVLISLPERKLGEKGVDLLGTLYLSRIRLATQRQFDQPEEKRVPFFVYLDEFQRFASSDISQFIAEARGAKIGLTMAHQWRSQIDDTAVRTAPMATGNKIVFQVTPEDASVFARDFSRYPNTYRSVEWSPEDVVIPAGIVHPAALGLASQDQQFVGYSGPSGWYSLDRALGSELIRLRTQEVQGCVEHVISEHWNTLFPGKSRDVYLSTEIRKDSERMIAKWYNEYHELIFSVVYALSPERAIEVHINAYLAARMRHEPDAESHFEGMTEDFTAAVIEALRIHWEDLPGAPWPPPMDRTVGSRLGQRREAVATALERIRQQTRLIGNLLEAHPIYENYYQIQSAHEQRKTEERQAERREESRLKPRSHEQIAQGLTNLPRYHAHCKISQGQQSVEVTVRMTQFEPFWEAADSDAIRERSRARYCLPMEDALALVQEQQGEPAVEEPEPAVVFMDAPPQRW